MADGRPRVVIVGGGFGGLSAARTLHRAPVDVTIIDRRNYHLFQPLLYQVATSGLNPGDIAAPIRRVLRKQSNATVLLGEAVSVDLEAREVILTDDRVAYDYLILASGSTHTYFGMDQWSEHAPGLTTIEDALEIRRRLLLAYESSERETDPVRQRALLTSVVIGGGPTGVELAGAVAEMGRHALAGEFRRFDPRQSRVVLVEGRERVLPGYPRILSAKAARSLGRLGVEVITSTRVTGIDADGVDLGDRRIETRNVFWAAGVRASAISERLGSPLDRSGRVLVRPDLTIPGRREVFVVGDLAAVAREGGYVPGLAPAAVQQGRHAAGNILRAVKSSTTPGAIDLDF